MNRRDIVKIYDIIISQYRPNNLMEAYGGTFGLHRISFAYRRCLEYVTSDQLIFLPSFYHRYERRIMHARMTSATTDYDMKNQFSRSTAHAELARVDPINNL